MPPPQLTLLLELLFSPFSLSSSSMRPSSDKRFHTRRFNAEEVEQLGFGVARPNVSMYVRIQQRKPFFYAKYSIVPYQNEMSSFFESSAWSTPVCDLAKASHLHRPGLHLKSICGFKAFSKKCQGSFWFILKSHPSLPHITCVELFSSQWEGFQFCFVIDGLLLFLSISRPNLQTS